MATPDDPEFSYDDSPHLYLFTSLTAGSSQIITATSRMETILKANRIPFRAVDCATDDKARQVWSRRSRGKRLPGLVKEGFVLGDLTVVEEWNEFGEIKMHLGTAKKPQASYVQEGPPPPGFDPSAEAKPKGTAEPADLAKKEEAAASSAAHAQHGQLAAEAAAAAAARSQHKSPLPILKKSVEADVYENDPEVEKNTIKNIHPSSTSATEDKPKEATATETEPKDAKSAAAADENDDDEEDGGDDNNDDDDDKAEKDQADGKDTEADKNRFSVASASPKPLRHKSRHSRSNSPREGEGSDVGSASPTSHATIAHPALAPPAAGVPGGSSGRSSMLRRAQDELEALLDLGDERTASEAGTEEPRVKSVRDSHLSGLSTFSDTQKPEPLTKDSISDDRRRSRALPAHPQGPDSEKADDHEPHPTSTLDEKADPPASAPRDSSALEDEAAKKASVSAKDGDAAGDSVED